MSLLSVQFLLFLAVFLTVYFLVPKKFQWIVLLIGNLVFYLVGNYRVAFYIAITIISQYTIAILIDKQNRLCHEELDSGAKDKAEKKSIKNKYGKRKKALLLTAVFINVGLLCFVKYINFFIGNINGILDLVHSGTQIGFMELIVPLGISFYTFTSLGYVIDVYRDKDSAEYNFFRFALFVSFFPTIIQGPIERHSSIAEDLYREHKFDYIRFSFGLQRMLYGYIKKIVIADRLSVITTEIIQNYAVNDYRGFLLFIGIFLNTFRVYCDFSGGMDIVCGISEIMGITLSENFDHPYVARSIADFWRRWHKTLGAWFGRYVFYPLSLSKAFNKLGRRLKGILGDNVGKVIPASIASFIVFLIIGFWHGANWKYFFYGLYSAFFVSTGTLMKDRYTEWKGKLGINEEGTAWIIFQVLRTNFLVTVGRYFSFAQSATDAFRMLKRTFTSFNPWIFSDGTLFKLGVNQYYFFFLMFAMFAVLLIDFFQEKGVRFREAIARRNIFVRWVVYLFGLYLILIFGMYGTEYNAVDFVYMRF